MESSHSTYSRTTNILDWYVNDNCYCSICLQDSLETRLIRTTDAAFFGAVQVTQATPYVCVRCRARVRCFHTMRSRVLRSQFWLYRLHQTQPCVMNMNKQDILRELEEIKADPLKMATPPTASVTCDGDIKTRLTLPDHRSDSRNDVVKTDPENCGKQNLDAIKEDFDVVWGNGKVYSEISGSEDDWGKLNKTHDRKLHGRAKHGNTERTKCKTSSKRRKVKQINENSGKVILDELDDVGRMLAGFMKEKVFAVKLSEEEYRRLHRERLTKSTYTSLPHKCESCAVAFHKTELYDRHMARHSPSQGPLACHLCGTRHETQSDLSTHTATHLRRYRCADCVHTGYNRQDVSNHYFAEHTRVQFFCRHCRLQTRGPFLVKEHILKKHKGRDEAVSQCGVCKKAVKSRSLLRHMRSHELATPIMCQLCGGWFKHAISLKQHADKYHGERSMRLEECSVCRKTIPASKMAAHKRKHAGDTNCLECNKTFADKYCLADHKRRMHEGKQRYQCNDCAVMYTTKASLRRHINFVHMKTGGVACPVCGKLCAHLGDMRSHVRSVHEKHLKPRDKLCDVCGRGFTTAKILLNHRLIHTGEKPHRCTECGQSFRQAAALRKHSEVHGKRLGKDRAVHKTRSITIQIPPAQFNACKE